MQNETFAEAAAGDPKDIWQHQSIEEYKMSIELLRLKSQQLAIKMRLDFVLLTCLLLGLIAFDLWSYATRSPSLQRAGFALAAAFALASLIHMAQKFWPSRLAKDAGSLACLAFSQFELRRRIASYGNFLPWLAGPIFVSILVLVAPSLWDGLKQPSQLLKGLPVLVLFALWIVAFLFVGRREKQKLRQELNELDGLASEHH